MVCLLHLDQWCVLSRVRVTRAPSLGLLIFCFHNLHGEGAFSVKIPCFIVSSSMEEFPTFWVLEEHLLVLFSTCLANFVPNMVVIIWIWLFYSEFCEGCESKKLKIAVGARVRARKESIFNDFDEECVVLHFLDLFREFFSYLVSVGRRIMVALTMR